MWQEAIDHVVGCWTNEHYEFSGKHWQMPRRRVQPKPLQQPHPPLWGATTATRATPRWAASGLGLCSFAVGLPPAEVKRKIDIYREAVATCTKPLGAFVNNQAATFTMAICDTDRQRAMANARESFEWYPKTGARQIATLTELMAERNQELGNYAYAADMKSHDDQGMLDLTQPGVPDGLQRLRAGHPRGVRGGLPASTRRPGSTCCCAWSTPTRSPTRPSCRPLS